MPKGINRLKGWFTGGNLDAFKMMVNKREVATLWNHWDSVPSICLKHYDLAPTWGKKEEEEEEDKEEEGWKSRKKKRTTRRKRKRRGKEHTAPRSIIGAIKNGVVKQWAGRGTALIYAGRGPSSFEKDRKALLPCNALHHCVRAMLFHWEIVTLFLPSHFVSMQRPEMRTNMAMAENPFSQVPQS